MKSRYNVLFKNLKKKKEGCFIPFTVLGDPSVKISLEIIDIFIKNGANALELGIPFSDPIADGDVIKNAHERALNNDININTCFSMIKKIREKHINIPIGILAYANIVFSKNMHHFYSQCADSGIDSILIVDVPIEESYEFQKLGKKNNISTIFICPPDANDEFIKKISQFKDGYVYLVSRSGITGIQEKYSNIILKTVIEKLKFYHSAPIIQGFGISTEKQIKNALNIGTQGVICGSIIVNLIEKLYLNKNYLYQEIEILIKKLKNATYNDTILSE